MLLSLLWGKIALLLRRGVEMIFVQTFKSNEFVGLLKNLLRDGGALFSADRAGQLKIEVDLP